MDMLSPGVKCEVKCEVRVAGKCQGVACGGEGGVGLLHTWLHAERGGTGEGSCAVRACHSGIHVLLHERVHPAKGT